MHTNFLDILAEPRFISQGADFTRSGDDLVTRSDDDLVTFLLEPHGYVKHIPREDFLWRCIEEADGDMPTAILRWFEQLGHEADELAKYPVAKLEAARGQYLIADTEAVNRRGLADLHVERAQKKEAVLTLLPYLGIKQTAAYLDVPVWLMSQDTWLFGGKTPRMWPRYLEAEAALREARYSFNEIGTMVGMSKGAVGRLAKILNLSSKKTDHALERKLEAQRLWSTGQWTHAQLADKFGVAKGTASVWVQHTPSPRSGKRGRPARSRNTNPLKAQALDMLRAGDDPSVVAEFAGVVFKTAQAWRRTLNT